MSNLNTLRGASELHVLSGQARKGAMMLTLTVTDRQSDNDCRSASRVAVYDLLPVGMEQILHQVI
jgi:hypothetical protein